MIACTAHHQLLDQVRFSFTMPTISRRFLGRSRPAGARLPLPEPFVSFSLPAKERIGLDDRQGRLPVEQLRPQQEGEAGCVAEPSWPDFVFLVNANCLRRKRFSAAKAGWEQAICLS